MHTHSCDPYTCTYGISRVPTRGHIYDKVVQISPLSCGYQLCDYTACDGAAHYCWTWGKGGWGGEGDEVEGIDGEGDLCGGMQSERGQEDRVRSKGGGVGGGGGMDNQRKKMKTTNHKECSSVLLFFVLYLCPLHLVPRTLG